MYVVIVRYKLPTGATSSLSYCGDFDCYDKALEKAKALIAGGMLEVEILKSRSIVTRKIEVNVKEV